MSGKNRALQKVTLGLVFATGNKSLVSDVDHIFFGLFEKVSKRSDVKLRVTGLGDSNSCLCLWVSTSPSTAAFLLFVRTHIYSNLTPGKTTY